MKRLTYPVAGLVVVVVLPSTAVLVANGDVTATELFLEIAMPLLGLLSCATGVAVASREPTNKVGWLLLGMGVGVAVLVGATAYSRVDGGHADLPAQDLMAWVSDVVAIPILFGMTGFLLLIFPDGRLVSPRWRPVACAFAATITAATVGYGFQPGTIDPGIPNPLALEGNAAAVAEFLAELSDVLGLPMLVLCAVSMLVRFRRSHATERQQLKWFAYATSIVGLGLGVSTIGVRPVSDIGFVMGLIGMILLPVATGLAILRYRLYDIDLVIRRTLVYSALTGALVATYLLLVLILQTLLQPVAGDSDIAVAGSTLAVAALFGPFRSAIQSVVDQRFYRSRYDADRTLEGFAGRLRHQLDLEQLGTDLRRVVAETMRPAHVSLWLRGER